jgi:methionyl aminopeptidase
MAITLRSRREIELIRDAGVVVAEVLSKLQEIADPGVSTGRLDAVASDMTVAAGAEALFKGVRSPGARSAFPACICASINEQVVHGIRVQRGIDSALIVAVDVPATVRMRL